MTKITINIVKRQLTETIFATYAIDRVAFSNIISVHFSHSIVSDSL